MGVMGLIKKMSKIDKECKKDDELRKRMEPWVIKMNNQKPTTKKDAERMSLAFIARYEQMKKDIASEYAKTGSISKIEQINER